MSMALCFWTSQARSSVPAMRSMAGRDFHGDAGVRTRQVQTLNTLRWARIIAPLFAAALLSIGLGHATSHAQQPATPAEQPSPATDAAAPAAPAPAKAAPAAEPAKEPAKPLLPDVEIIVSGLVLMNGPALF